MRSSGFDGIAGGVDLAESWRRRRMAAARFEVKRPRRRCGDTVAAGDRSGCDEPGRFR
jgi:hypothetical protein